MKSISDGSYGKSKHAVIHICQHVRKHIKDYHSLVQCAELVEMNPCYISRIFKRETGQTFVEFVTLCKLKESQKMLSGTDMNMEQIAEAIGFSTRHFHRVFQKYYRVSPAQYRLIRSAEIDGHARTFVWSG
jgi:two-component system response regulator YesN